MSLWLTGNIDRGSYGPFAFGNPCQPFLSATYKTRVGDEPARRMSAADSPTGSLQGMLHDHVLTSTRRPLALQRSSRFQVPCEAAKELGPGVGTRTWLGGIRTVLLSYSHDGLDGL